MNLRALLAALLLSTGLAAQVAAPDFRCTRSEGGGEILSWQNVDNNCGPYVATEIYVATAEAGPYALLTRLTDRSVIEYRDENPNGEQRFYYLQYVYDCPGQEVLRSDTLDSFIPVVPEVNFLSVENGGLRLSWTASPSPEVSGYVIYEVTAAGIFPLDTVGTVTSYRIDGVPDDELTTRRYRIAAIDPCENDSPQSRIVSATGLVGSGGNGCDSDIALSPLISESSTVFADSLDDPSGSLELFVSIGGGAFRPARYVVDSVRSNTIIYEAGRDGQEVCFYLQQGLTSGDSVRTDTLCRSLSITPRLPPVELYGYEHDDAGRMIIKYYAGEAIGPLIDEVTLSYGGANEPQVRVPIAAADFTRDSLVVSGLPPQDPGRVILLEFFDGCNRQLLTNPANGTFLFAESVGGQIQLNWVPAGNDDANIRRTFTILRQTAAGDFETIEENWLAANYLDTSVSSGCYRVITNFTPPDRDTLLTFRSNVACAAADIQIYVPNVFSLDADRPENRTFRPLYSGDVVPTDYSLRVYDRWGALYFESADPSRGWDGTLGGSKAPTGSYIYVLTYRSGQSNLVERTGVVTLIR